MLSRQGSIIGKHDINVESSQGYLLGRDSEFHQRDRLEYTHDDLCLFFQVGCWILINGSRVNRPISTLQRK
jgi:hypothetical protein